MSMRMLSQLAHVELLTTALEKSTTFFTDVLGLEESGRTGESVYLRCWGERFHHSVKLTQSPRTGVGHIGWRSDGQDGLDESVRRIEASGVTGEWLDDETGHGPAYRFRAPSGQLHEVFWEVDRWEAPAGLASTFPSRPQKLGTRGCALRQIDHISVPSVADLMPTTKWFRDTLGFRCPRKVHWTSTAPARHRIPSWRSSRPTRTRPDSPPVTHGIRLHRKTLNRRRQAS